MEGSGGTAPAQGATQPPASGQGEPTGGAKADGFWGNFPDVPEEQRALLEPHLKNVQGHVTKLEQQYAPWKSFADGGVNPEHLQGVLGFMQSYDQDPVGTWINMAQRMQEAGLLDGDLDLDQIQAVAQGQPGPQDGGEGEITEGLPEEGGYEDPRVAQLEQQLAQVHQMVQQDQQARRQAVEDALLQKTTEQVKTKLGEAGIDINAVPDGERLLIAAIVANGGHADNAVAQLTGYRDGTVKKVVGDAEEAKTQKGEVTMPKGAPKGKGLAKKSGDPWREASKGAEAMLSKAAEAAAQEG